MAQSVRFAGIIKIEALSVHWGGNVSCSVVCRSYICGDLIYACNNYYAFRAVHKCGDAVARSVYIYKDSVRAECVRAHKEGIAEKTLSHYFNVFLARGRFSSVEYLVSSLVKLIYKSRFFNTYRAAEGYCIRYIGKLQRKLCGLLLCAYKICVKVSFLELCNGFLCQKGKPLAIQ